MLIAISIAHCLAVVLIDLVESVAVRASAPTWSTPGRPWRNRRRLESLAVRSAIGSRAVVGAVTQSV